MTLTIDLPEDTLAALTERARAEGRPVAELAGEAVADRYGFNGEASDEADLPLDAETIEKIRRGFADMDAGRTVSLAESQARIEALLAARQGDGRA